MRSYRDSTDGERPRRLPARDEHGPAQPALDLTSLASLAGSSAVARLASRRVQRAPVASTADAVAAAPGGPLAQLKDELDDDEVNEGKCLKWIGQLSEGERTLVRRDRPLMDLMAGAFDRNEMAQAVEVLGFTVNWQFLWILSAADGGHLSPERADRLLGAVKNPAEFDEFVRIALAIPGLVDLVDLDPLSIAVCRANPASVTTWLGVLPFVSWVLARSGATNLAIWLGANAPAQGIASLKASGGWALLLDALRAAGPVGAAREALRAIFVAATDAEDRRTLYEIRFDRRAQGPFDWIANGEAEWRQQESFAGGGQTTATIEAGIAAGAPATADAVIKASPKGPVAQLADLLDDDDVDEGQCLRLLAGLTDAELLLVGRDTTLTHRMARAFNGQEMTRALDLLRFMPLAPALAFIDDSNEEGSIKDTVYQTIANRSTDAEVLAAAMLPDACKILQDHSRIDPLSLSITANDLYMQQLFAGCNQFVEWCLRNAGGPQALLRYVAARPGAAVLYQSLRTSGMSGSLVSLLPTGTALPAQDQAALKVLFKAVTDEPGKSQLLMVRFNFDRVGEDRKYDGAGTFEPAVLDQIWELLERLPPRDVADNDWLEDLTRRTNPDNTAQGVTGSNRVAVGYDPAKMGDLESGAFTDPTDVMRGLNIFDANLIHEMGHASDREHGWTKDGGPLDTVAALGQWKNHGDDTDEIVDIWLADAGLGFGSGLTEDQVDMCRQAFIVAMDKGIVTVEPAFKLLAALHWTPYGSSDDEWAPLWSLVKGHALVQIVSASQYADGAQSPWNNPPQAVGGRIYHDTGYDEWASYLASARTGSKLSRYAFRDKSDFFAELYATYYATVPAGTAVRAWNAAVYDWFTANVDAGRGTTATP